MFLRYKRILDGSSPLKQGESSSSSIVNMEILEGAEYAVYEQEGILANMGDGYMVMNWHLAGIQV